MIPYIEIPSLPPHSSVAIHPFGVLVATGILAGAALTQRRGQKLGLNYDMVRSMIFWSVFSGFVLAHLLDVLVYQGWDNWDMIVEHWGIPLPQKLWALIDVRTGLSSMGGFAGAVGGLWLWCRRNKQEVLAYADSLAFGLALGWMLGRLGCFVAHDHPGHLTSFFLGVDYPGGRRHDLGLEEALVAAALTLFYLVAERFRPRKGFFVAAIATYYGPVRFFLDYLRVTPGEMHNADPRFLGLTPAQYAAILVFAVGLLLCVYVARRRPVEYPSS